MRQQSLTFWGAVVLNCGVQLTCMLLLAFLQHQLHCWCYDVTYKGCTDALYRITPWPALQSTACAPTNGLHFWPPVRTSWLVQSCSSIEAGQALLGQPLSSLHGDALFCPACAILPRTRGLPLLAQSSCSDPAWLALDLPACMSPACLTRLTTATANIPAVDLHW